MVPDEWIDRVHAGCTGLVWRSAMYVDRLFGAQEDESVYRDQARGSITPAVFWDEFGGLDHKFRFRVKLPLPHLDERYDAFIGTFSRDEYVTEREQESGAIQRQHARGTDRRRSDAGRHPLSGTGERAGASKPMQAVRIRSPIDPFVKAGYRYERGSPDTGAGQFARDCLLAEQRRVRSHQPPRSGAARGRCVGSCAGPRRARSRNKAKGCAAIQPSRLIGAYGIDERVGAQIFTAGEFDAAVPLR